MKTIHSPGSTHGSMLVKRSAGRVLRECASIGVSMAMRVWLGMVLVARILAGDVSSAGSHLLIAFEGKVEVLRTSGTTWQAAETNMVLQVKDRVRTHLKSRATVRLSDQSVLRLNQLTTLEIQPPRSQGAGSVLDLRSGAAFLSSREASAENELRTPKASGAVRGTEVAVVVAENGDTTVTVLDGQVDLSNDQGSISLITGEQGVVDGSAAPRKTAVIDLRRSIQWALYYPAVLDLDEVPPATRDHPALRPAVEAYRSGDVVGAIQAWPVGREPGTEGERILRAALALAAGQVEAAEADLAQAGHDTAPSRAIRRMLEVVRSSDHASGSAESPPPQPAASASLALAESYVSQSAFRLDEALKLAQSAVARSPGFAFGWARIAELEFGLGRVGLAHAALDRALKLAPRHAAGTALRGFLLAAENRTSAAHQVFEDAIRLDSALSWGWLGRGLNRIRRGQDELGRQDLQVAATLEPQRGILRSYLGKAYSQTRDLVRADRELDRARALDPQDPTAWLYLALLRQQQNRPREALDSLELSVALNDTRRLFRSRLLLDQDRAVRGVNLANLYHDAGMTEFGLLEAARSVSEDYANASAHRFLANAYNASLDPRKVNLRYEAPYFSEYLMAQLLAPVGAGSLSQQVSQQEYSRLLDRDGFRLSSKTEYRSSGQWWQTGGLAGNSGRVSLAFDQEFLRDPGWQHRPNSDLERLDLYARLKLELSPQDVAYLEFQRFQLDAGDVAPYYNVYGDRPGLSAPSIGNPDSGEPGLRIRETFEPNLFVGYRHDWQPGLHTLALVGYLDNEFQRSDSFQRTPFLVQTGGQVEQVFARWSQAARQQRQTEAYSAELQQLWSHDFGTLVVGSRYQSGDNAVRDWVGLPDGSAVVDQSLKAELERFSVYAYSLWDLHPRFQLTAGLAYDTLHYPMNVDTSPVRPGERNDDQLSPKVGGVWTPWEKTHVRGAYTRSLGGVWFDQSVRLEPTVVSGFNQLFRSLAPEAVVGLIPGSLFETVSLGIDHVLPSRTYISAEVHWLRSEGRREVGVLQNSIDGFPLADTAAATSQQVDFRERAVLLAMDQWLGTNWSAGVRYRLGTADLGSQFPDIPVTARGVDEFNGVVRAVLHRVNLSLRYHHRCGFFGATSADWMVQSNQGYSSDMPGDDVWQWHAILGYRVPRRPAELSLALLNISDQDYRLNPLNLITEPPRERTLVVSLKLNF